MRRIHSSFAAGAPGVGLLLLRLTCATSLLWNAVVELQHGPGLLGLLIQGGAAGGGLLVAGGLWMPITGVLAAIEALVNAFSSPMHLGYWLLVMAVGAALALLGPGVWSIDAKRLGLRQIEIPVGNE